MVGDKKIENGRGSSEVVGGSTKVVGGKNCPKNGKGVKFL